ncbi:MAG: LamG-like jellyroll fold domain-containing protein, partial [Bacteroidota bacterium]
MLHPRSLFPIALFISLVMFPLEGFSQPLIYSALTSPAPVVIPNKGMQAGVYSWMEIADNPSIAIPVFTVEVWVKASSGGLIVTRDIGTGTPSDWQLWYEFSRKRLAFITAKSPPDSYFYTPDNSFLPNIWYHVALVVNGPSGHAYLYINGNLVISPTFTSRNFDCTTGLAWCGYYNNGGGAYLNGVIDEARYWNLERTQAQINATKDIDIPQNDRMGLVGWWRFCNSYEDYSGAGNHGTPMGNPQLVPINLPFGITCDLNPCDTVQVFITGTQGICENDSTVLTASPGFVSYRWSTGDTTQSIIARKAGWYSVDVIHGNGCVAQANFEVIVFPLPLADAGPDITVCAGVSARLGTTPHNPSWKYNWTPPVGLSNTDSARTKVQTSVTRSYLFTVTNEHGCSSSDTVLVTVQSGLDLALPDSLHICPGSSVSLPLGVLSGFPPYSFQWSPPTSLSATDVQNPVASPSASRWYYVLVTDSMGCFSSDSIFIAITNGLETLLPDSIGICKGGSIRLPLVVRLGTPPYTFHWTPAGTLSATDVQNPVATPDSTRWYYVTVKDTLGCEGKDSILVKAGEGLRTAMPDTIFICPNVSVILPLSVSGYTGSVQFSWTPEGDLNNPHTQRPVARPGRTTTYYVHAIDSLGCEARDSVTVALFPKTDLTITIDGAAVFCDGDSVRLLATPGFKSYRWTTPSRTLPDTGNSIIAREPGRYYITVVDANGCEVTSLPVTISTFAAFQLPITLHGNQPLCPGDSITLETAGGYTDYIWFDDSGRVIGTGERITIGKAGKYSVIARDSSGCIGGSVPVVITVAAKPVFDITGPKLVCIGSEQVYATLFRSRWVYEWTVTDGDIQSPDDRQSARILWTRAGRMTIHLLVRDTLTGCADSVTYTVDVITELHPEVSADGPTIFCEGDSVLLHSRETYDLGEWTDGEGQILGSGSSLIARTSGMYYFQAMTADSCSGMDSILVTVLPTPRPRILGPIEICLGDTSAYAVQNGSNAILWIFSGGKHIG